MDMLLACMVYCALLQVHEYIDLFPASTLRSFLRRKTQGPEMRLCSQATSETVVTSGKTIRLS